MDDESSSNYDWWYYNYHYYINNPTVDYSTDHEYVEGSATKIQKHWKRYVRLEAKSKIASVSGLRWRHKKRFMLLGVKMPQ
jgi:hypothetical protein